MDKTVFGIHDGGFAILQGLFLHTLGCLVTGCEDFLGRFQMTYVFLGVLIILQQLDREVSGRVALADGIICLQIFLDMLDTMFYLMSVVDVDMAIVSAGIFLAFVEFDDGFEELVHASAIGEDGRNHRDTEEFAQFVVVDVIATLLGFIKHIEGADHADVHIYQLCGEIEIALQVAGVNDVDDDIRRMLDELLAHIEFFWRISREGIGTRQIYQIEVVAVEIGFTYFRIHGYTAIVAYAFVSTRSKVEEGSLTAVWISHQCHVDDAVESFCFLFSQGFVAGIVFSFSHEHLVTECLLVAIVGIYYF